MPPIPEILDSLSAILDTCTELPAGPSNRLRARIASARLAPDRAGQIVALGLVRAGIDDCLMCLDADEVC